MHSAQGTPNRKITVLDKYEPALVAPPNQLLATVDSAAKASSKTEESEIFIMYHRVCALCDFPVLRKRMIRPVTAVGKAVSDLPKW